MQRTRKLQKQDPVLLGWKKENRAYFLVAARKSYVDAVTHLQVLITENLMSSGWSHVMCNDGWDRSNPCFLLSPVFLIQPSLHITLQQPEQVKFSTNSISRHINTHVNSAYTSVALKESIPSRLPKNTYGSLSFTLGVQDVVFLNYLYGFTLFGFHFIDLLVKSRSQTFIPM
jgi:hypothetical protein